MSLEYTRDVDSDSKRLYIILLLLYMFMGCTLIVSVRSQLSFESCVGNGRHLRLHTLALRALYTIYGLQAEVTIIMKVER